jgi:RND family efflux transporter MFP subunit
MNSTGKRGKKQQNRTIGGILLIVVLAAAAGGAYYWFHFNQVKTAQKTATNSQQQTEAARIGNLIVSTSGTGTLDAGKQVNLSFSSSGTVASVRTQVGDTVKAGQVLAQLSGVESLQANLHAAQLNLITAQQALDTYKSGSSAAIGQAQLDLAKAQKAYTDAQTALKAPGMARCDQSTTDAYYQKYMLAQQNLDKLGTASTNSDTYIKIIAPAKQTRDQAWATYQYCAGFTNYEISSSQANLVLTQAQVVQAQQTLQTLVQNKGLDPTQLALDQNKVDSAQDAVNSAQQAIDGASITAPFDGSVLSIAGQVGDTVGTETFIVLADLKHPVITFYVDETDMQNVAVGDRADVTFDAIPDTSFSGKVSLLLPQLVTVSGYKTLEGQAQLDPNPELDKAFLSSGMSASVTIINGQANNAVLIPIEALRDLGDGSYGVFVSDSSGTLTFRPVTVGLMTATDVQITSGLKAGELVSLSQGATTSTSATPGSTSRNPATGNGQ